jgi:hypothetical protein
LEALQRWAEPEPAGDATAAGVADGASRLAPGVNGDGPLGVDAAGAFAAHAPRARTARDQVTHRTHFIGTLLRPYDATAGRL